jgi:hypothetical protein
MIPEVLLQSLLDDLVCAVASAVRGEWSVGYDLLLTGLLHAQTTLEQDLPWGRELVQRYQQVIAAFEERYRVRLP